MNTLKVFTLMVLVCLALVSVTAKEEAIIGLSEHELGDQSLAVNAGLFIPLSFYDFGGGFVDANQTLGMAGAIQWYAYVNSVIRLGIEVGMGFTFGPGTDMPVFLMVPVTIKGTYLFYFDRFEFPVSLGIGANVVKYSTENLYDVTLIAKPQLAAYYRVNSNLSFGLNVLWWLNLEFPTQDYNSTVIGNSLEISPSLFYHF